MLRQILADTRFRLRAVFQRRAMDQELDDEFRFHIDAEAAKHIRAGMAPDEARRVARAAFGGIEGIKDDTRDARGLVIVETLLQDIRYAARGLATRPVFAAGIVLTLGLGIGANATMFGIVDRLLFRAPATLEAPDRTHRVYASYDSDGQRRTTRNLAYPTYRDLLVGSQTMDVIAAFQTRQLPVGDGADTRELRVTIASASYFSLFDATPLHGRFFDTGDDSIPAGQPVAVLGYAYWRTRFGGQPDVIGKTLRINRIPRTIIGIAPEDFVGMTDQGVPAAYVPISNYAHEFRGPRYTSNYNWSWLEVAARRKPGVSVTAAEADLKAAYWQSWRNEAAANPGSGTPDSVRAAITLGPVQLNRGPQAGRDSVVARWTAGVALIVLLIACANVANLLLSRALGRQREIAVRLALGVTRRRLVRQLMAESVLLALLGGAAGLAMAQWGSATLRTFFFTADEALTVTTDGRTFWFAVVATLVVGALTGLVPALQAGRADLASALKTGSREGTYRRSRTRTALIVLQATLSVILLVGAGLFVRSLQNVQDFRLGYDADRLVFAGANLRGVNLTDEETTALNDRMLRASLEVPGVTHAAVVASVPFFSNEGRGLWSPEVDSIRTLGQFTLQSGTPDYFATTGTRILRGRPFDESDRGDAPPVVVVSEGMARVIWKTDDAVGKCLRIGSPTAPCSTVIGIAEEMRARSLTDAREFTYYIPAAQYGSPLYQQLFVRVTGDPAAFVEPLRRRLQRELPGAAYADAMPLGRLIDPQRRSWEFGATMFVAFGGLALVLAAIGLYSLIAYDVAQRTQELGVRLALGASIHDVMRLVVSSGVRLVLAGVILGGGLALWGSKWMENLMFQQSPRDPLVFGVVAITLLVVALVASSGPAFRASRVDPNIALRND